MSASRKALVVFAILAIAAATAAVVASAVPAAQADTAPGFTIGPNEIRPDGEEEEDAVNRDVPTSRSEAHVSSSHVPRPATVAVESPGAELGTSFAGLDHFDQRLGADDGNQFSLEPPDQGLCVGNGIVIEPVNDVVATYDAATGAKTSGTISLTRFYSGKAQIVRDDPDATEIFGPFLSDPKCYYDPGLDRFFMTILEIDQDPVTGAFGDHTSELIAVSRNGTPTLDAADWHFYSIDTSDDGGAAADTADGVPVPGRTMPDHPGCPCLGDQPLIGADAFGFYVTTNEFSLEGPNFNGAQVYAIGKAGLANGELRLQAIHGAPIPLAEGPAYSLQPATSPTAADWDTSAGGTEYLLSALDFDATLDDRIAAWALTNTSSLDAVPDVRLSHVVLDSEVYGQPPDAVQKDGATPLAQVVQQQNGAKNPQSGGSAKEELLAGNDDRMNQAVYAAGHLWGAVNTVAKTDNGPTHVAAAYFDVTPSVASDGTLAASIARQGYVAADRQNVLYPSIGVTHDGDAVLVATLAGPDFFPSSVYTTIGADGPGPLKVAGAGLGPDDGFTGYPPFGGPTARWGDYSAAVADANGTVWMATEYIGQTCTFAEFAQDTTCGGTRSLLANWGTFVSSVTP